MILALSNRWIIFLACVLIVLLLPACLFFFGDGTIGMHELKTWHLKGTPGSSSSLTSGSSSPGLNSSTGSLSSSPSPMRKPNRPRSVNTSSTCIKAPLAMDLESSAPSKPSRTLCKLHDVVYSPGGLTWGGGKSTAAKRFSGSLKLQVRHGNWLDVAPTSVSWPVGSSPHDLVVSYEDEVSDGDPKTTESFDLVVVWIRGFNNICKWVTSSSNVLI